MNQKSSLRKVPQFVSGVLTGNRPEAAYSGSWTYNQVRLGGHITGFTVAGVNTGVSLGFVRDSNYGKGVYAGLNFQVNF